MKTSTTLVLSEGKTLTYLIPIVFCGIGALVSFAFLPPLAIVFIIAGILLGMTEIGLEFNSETLEYRKFKSVNGFIWGKWTKIQNPDSFHLRLSVDSHSYRTFGLLSNPSFYGRGTTSQSKTITYDVLFLTKADQRVIIYQFPSYKLALQLLEKLRELESLEVTDHIALRLEENQQKRMNRRR